MQHEHDHSQQDQLYAQLEQGTRSTEPSEPDQGNSESPDSRPQGVPRGRHGSPVVQRHAPTNDDPAGVVHLLFGSLEDLLADLSENGAPEANIVRVERLVRSRSHSVGGTATLGVAVTARRADEILSVWVIVARLALDPWGQLVSRVEAHAATMRHREAQRMLAAFAADAGFAVRGSLYLLSESCYGLNASAVALASATSTTATTATTDEAPDTQRAAEQLGGGEHA